MGLKAIGIFAVILMSFGSIFTIFWEYGVFLGDNSNLDFE